MSLPSLAEVYARWHNPNCGFELEPDRNVGTAQTSENGILFHSTFLMLLDMRGEGSSYAYETFLRDIVNLKTDTSGVFDRAAGDSKNIPYATRNENSQDNYLGILCFPGKTLESRINIYSIIKNDIAKHGMFHFFIYNNVSPRISLPMNPGNWSIFLATANYNKFFELLFLPFFIVNFFITNFLMSAWESFKKVPQSTSNKILYLLILYCLRNRFGYKWMYNLYIKRMRKLFGENFVEELMKIYYHHAEHPNRLYAAGIKLEEI
jgi:hypothetical protein